MVDNEAKNSYYSNYKIKIFQLALVSLGFLIAIICCKQFFAIIIIIISFRLHPRNVRSSDRNSQTSLPSHENVLMFAQSLNNENRINVDEKPEDFIQI